MRSTPSAGRRPDGPDRAMTGTRGRWENSPGNGATSTTHPRHRPGPRPMADSYRLVSHRPGCIPPPGPRSDHESDEQVNGIRTAHDRTAADRQTRQRANRTQ
jgi:hypothetical protein